jgi:HK97 family phage portal protein
MGLKDFLFPAVTTEAPEASLDVAASLAPVNSIDSLGSPYFRGAQTATRYEAMGVPTIARARGIICSTVASLPLETYDKVTEQSVPSVRVINQPDPRITGAEFWAWIAEDLLFRPSAFAWVMNRYADTGRIQAMERIAPERVTVTTNSIGTEIEGYLIDGRPVDASNLVVFGAMDEGLLQRGGRTIRAAHALEKSAFNFAINPIPQTVLKSNGVALPKERVSALLSAWRLARQESSTAFLNADVSLDTVGYDPKNLQLNEARQYLALELSRAIGLPAWFASADPSSMTYSNSVNQRRDLIDFSIRPILTVIEQRLSMTDFTPASQYVRFDLDDFLRGNPLERAQVYQILTNIGAMTPEEVRKEEDITS